MANRVLRSLVLVPLVFAYGLFTLVLYCGYAVKAGYFFRKPTEKEDLELQLARNRFWDLSQDWSGLSHHFLTLRNGFRFHYLSNDAPGTLGSGATKPLVIFVHGFPDSWAIWRHIVGSASLQSAATVVAVDLPGYGGSDELERYSATNVLEALTEFIIATRANYGIDDDSTTTSNGQRRTIIVGHDWGCVISMRLAADAPELADRWILTNGPLPSLVRANGRRALSSSLKMFRTWLRSPLRSRSTLVKAIKALAPVLRQAILSGYVFVMRMPPVFVRYLGAGGNYSFLKMTHRLSYGKTEFTPRDAAECMASTRGPSPEELKTTTADGEAYPESVKKNRALANFLSPTLYYRHNAGFGRWHKSLETIADLHGIARGRELTRSSNSGTGLLGDGTEGALKAPATIIWGQNDVALERQLCLDGISDYLVPKSYVILLPGADHFTPVEEGSRMVLAKATEWAIKGEKEDIGTVVEACYPGAVVTVRK